MEEKVLIVDDERFFLTILGDFFVDRLHMRPTLVQDPSAALAIVDAEHPSLVLLDILMPEVNGLEVLRQIKARQPMLPVVMVTSTLEIDHAITALREGAEDFVRKPVDLELLGSIVRKILHKQEIDLIPQPARDASHNRRRATRVRMRSVQPAQLHLMEVSVIDLSPAGALVEHTVPVRLGEIYRLSIPTGSQRIQVLARAVRAFASHRITVAGGERAVVYRTGMEFVGVDKLSAERIASYVEDLERTG